MWLELSVFSKCVGTVRGTRICHALNSQALEMGDFSFSPLPLGGSFVDNIRLGEEKDQFFLDFVGFDRCLLL